MRKILNDEQIHPTMRDQINSFHADIVAEVDAAVQANRIVYKNVWNKRINSLSKVFAAWPAYAYFNKAMPMVKLSTDFLIPLWD